MKLHRYTPLPDGKNFRVLHLWPSSKGEPLQCDLIITSIYDYDVRYEALSYAWGSLRWRDEVICDGSIIRITHSLSLVLRQLRLEHQDRYLWIDQLCINQADTTELEHQVHIMSTIYHDSDKVIAWLGPGNGRDPELAKSAIDILAAVNEARAKRNIVAESTLRQRIGRDHLLALQRLTVLEYWTRVWVLRELRVARHIDLIWGSTHIDFHKLRQAFRWLCDEETCIRRSTNISIDSDILKPFILPVVDHIDLVFAARFSQATRLSDKVFALQQARCIPESTIKCNADYRARPEDVYQQFAEKYAEKDNHLALLSYAACIPFDARQRGPSWVPQWDYFMTDEAMAYRRLLRLPAKMPIPLDNTTNPGVCCSMLTLPGAKLDIVNCTTHPTLGLPETFTTQNGYQAESLDQVCDGDVLCDLMQEDLCLTTILRPVGGDRCRHHHCRQYKFVGLASIKKRGRRLSRGNNHYDIV